MYSVRKTRSLSICLLMVLSTLGPIAAPVTADHEQEDWPDDWSYIELSIEIGGSWEGLHPYDDPFEIGAGTYDMQIDYHNLDVGSNYTLSWSMYGINEDWGDLEGNVTSENVTDTWQMEVSEFDCWFNVNVAIINNTDGQWDNVQSENYNFKGECAEYGTVTYSADIGGTWVSEPDEMDVGDYDMSWDVTSLTTGEEYKLDYWYYLSGQRIEFGSDRVEDGYEWVATGTDAEIDWNVSISATDCTLQPESMLWENTSSGWTVVDQYWVGQWSEVVLLPCESMLTVSWFNNDTGDWEELDNLWSNNWAGAGIYEGLGSCQEMEDEGDWYWECMDDDGNDETWDACNEGDEEYWCWNFHEVTFLEPGDYDVQLEVSHLEVGSSYALDLRWFHNGYFDSTSEDDYIEFTAPSDTLTLNQTLTIGLGTCNEEFEAYLHENVTDGSGGTDHITIQEGRWMIEGPCEEPPSPFTLYYDGVEHEEIAHNMTGLEDCQEMGEPPESGYECYVDYDGDGNWDDVRWFEDCSDDGTGWWECVEYYENPFISEGNHSMEVEVEDLEAGTGYQLNVDVYHHKQFSSWSDHATEEFNASSDTHSYSFTVETDNFTCGLTIHLSISSDDGYYAEDVFYFTGPCEEPPSPFTLYHDGVEYERIAHTMSGFDDCQDWGDGYECYVDYDGDGYWDDMWWFEECTNGTAGWECVEWYEDPFLDAANHSMTLEVEGLEAGTSYGLWFNIHQNSQQGDWEEWGEELFNATSENYSSSGHIETDNFTCGLNIDISLFENNSEDDGNWWHEEVYRENFQFHGPCEEIPSPFTLYYDGVEHEQVAHNMTGFDDCQDMDDGYECYVDYDGDGYWDDMWWFEDCTNGTAGWECVEWYEDPYIDAGNHSMTLEVEDLEAGRSYALWFDINVNTQQGGDYESVEEAFNATSDTYSTSGWVETDNFTCNLNIYVSLYENESDGSGNWWHNQIASDWFNFRGPCEEIPSPFTLYVDGSEYERIAHNMTGFDDCQDMDDGYECYVDYDGDGYWDDMWWFEDCTNGTAGWECVNWYDDPLVEAGNHTGWLDVEGLDPDGSYLLEWYDQRCTQQGCEGMSGDWGGPFNESNEWDYDSASGLWTHDGYYFNTDNYTCGYSSQFRLYEVDWDDQGNWWMAQMLYEEWFNFRGPCEEIPSPFTLYYDGVEHEQVANNMTGFDWCDEMDGYFECWIGYDWDGDGEPDDYDNWGFEECSNLSTGWECVEWYEDPFLAAGNHSMTLEIEDLETGLNYSVSIHININTQQGGEYEEGYEDFTASSDTYSTSGHIETDNFTCNLNIHVSLDENESDGSGNWWHHQIASDWFNFRGPCEQPPSPFTLYYDGIEYEQIVHYNEYDQCEDDTGGSGIEQYRCWDDDWDGDGDGEPDYWDYQYNCEEDANGTWWCEGWHQNPYIDAGNHSMALDVEDLETGQSYAVMYNTDVCTSMMGCEWDSFEELFNASSDVESLSFFLETDNSTCSANIHATLYEVSWDEDGNWWHDRHLFGEGFGFDGPCEQPPSPIHLIYTDENGDEVEWEPEMESHEYDECDDYGDHFECWYNDEGDEMIWEDDCEEQADGTWLCESPGGGPDIAEGDHGMTWNVTDLEDGKNYSLMWSVYSMSMMAYDMDDWQENFTASSDAHDIDWSLHVDNSTCGVMINAQLTQPVDYDEDGIVDWYDYVAYAGFNFDGPCEMSFPVDIGLEIEDGGAWFDVEGVPLEVIFCEDCDYDEGDEMGLILQYVGYNLTAAGEYDLRWTLSGLTVGENYTFEYGPEGPGDSDGDVYWDIYSYCEWEGTDEGDERWWCTDDGDGSDGFDDWWFYCEYDAEDDQWWCTDDFGQNPDWEFSADGTEHEGADGAQGQGDEYEWTAASETEEISWAIEIGNDTCVLIIQGQAYSSNEWGDEMFAGMFIGIIAGPAFGPDGNGNGMPDCIEMMGPGPGPDGPQMGSQMGHLALGLDDGTGDIMEPYPYQHLDVGTHDMTFAAMDLMPIENYVLSFSAGLDGELIEETVNISTDDDGWAQHDFSITLTDWDCIIVVDAELARVDASIYEWVDSFLMILEGPCMGGSLEGLISAEAIDENGMSHALTNDEGYREFLDHGAYEVVVEVSGLTAGTDYTVDYAYLEGVLGVAEVIAQLWDSEGLGDEWNFTANGSEESFSLWIEIHDYTCGAFMIVEVSENEDTGSGDDHDVAYAFVDTPCGGGGDGDWDLMMFAIDVGYNAAFYGISDNGSEAMVYVEQWVTLDDEFRMKVDADFGDGDGYLNQTEADEFAGMVAQGMVESDDSDAPDGLLLNGLAPWSNETMGMLFVDLANDSGGSVQMVLGWTMHYDPGADAAGNHALSYAGEDATGGDGDDEGGDELFPFETTMCAYTQADGYHLVYVEINGTVVSEITGAELYLSHCWTLAPWEEVTPFTVTWGQIDSDGDGVGDLDDAFPNDANETADTDGDGVGNNADRFPDDPNEYSDMDDDGVGDNSDEFPYDPTESADSDGDGWGDNSDAFPNDGTEWVDTDGDGTGDNADTDADGDGIDDDAEDSDGDGVYDDQDAFPFDANETVDSDGDGVGDNGDAFPNDANETTDTDGDGIGDNSDDDADGDGQPNDLDDFPLNSEESTDTDGDGVGDNEDEFPNDSSEHIDSDGDGTGDNADTDDDDDGVPDVSDAFPLDDTESADTDGDGTGDNADAFPNDPYERHDSDGDGVGDNTDAFPSNPSEWADSDNDGVGDNTDAFPNDSNEVVDSDGDGVGNNADAFPYDNTETADSDGDGVGDNAQAANEEEPEITDEDDDDGGLFGLPGFSATMSLVSMLGAAILIAGRRKD